MDCGHLSREHGFHLVPRCKARDYGNSKIQFPFSVVVFELTKQVLKEIPVSRTKRLNNSSEVTAPWTHQRYSISVGSQKDQPYAELLLPVPGGDLRALQTVFYTFALPFRGTSFEASVTIKSGVTPTLYGVVP